MMSARVSISFGHRVILLVACIAAFATTSYNRALRPPRPDVAFARDAGGRQAIGDAEWPMALRPARLGSVGMIDAAAFCGGDAFLLDSRQSSVHRIDMVSGQQIDAIGAPGGAPGTPKKPRAMALDCEGGRLYLVDDSGVFVYDLISEQFVRHILKPDTFVYSGGQVLLDAANDLLFVPGVWPAARHDWLIKSVDSMFESDRLGYRLSLRDGTVAPMFAPIERGCWIYTSDCLNAVFDTVRGGRSGAAWVAAQSVSTQVGVFDAQYRLQRTVDIRSPRFLEDGARAFRADGIVAEVKWHETNSVIRRVYAFGDRLVTIHTTNRTKGWTPGHPIDFDVFMNVHSMTGEPLVSDVQLANLPVGRDDRHLFVVDYGAGGRRPGTHNLRLVRYQVTE